MKEKREYTCWLGYYPLQDETLRNHYKTWCSGIAVQSVPLATALSELKRGIAGILGTEPVPEVGSPLNQSLQMGLIEDINRRNIQITPGEIEKIGEEGFIIKLCGKGPVIAGKTDKGVLYGVFAFLRMLQTGTKPDAFYRIETPVNPLRMINQWDNMDGSIERGYAGNSIFYENNQFRGDSDRIRDYARLLASVGINGISINNVNVHQVETRLITKDFLPQVAQTVDILREYGIKLYLSINYSSPMELGGLSTADPLDSSVQSWWCEKAKEAYEAIPDLGGFLVKADSENRPGPFTYGRNHAEGANLLARALKPFGGIVIWRCFVYNCKQDWRDRVTDRANAAYDNFMPLDGRFMDNVVLQIKNGPMDFQVREPVSPLLGGLKKTNVMLELQVTQEYTGQQKHVCYLIPQWKEVFDFDTYAQGEGSTVKKVVSGDLYPQKFCGIAAVSNIGDESTWTGHILAQANLYGYGRLIWNPDYTSEEISEEWIRLTFSCDPQVVDKLREILLKSWPAYEAYTSPLGIGWMVNPGFHYGPSVDGYEYSAWGTYHRADRFGIGVDRTVAAGTGYAGRYYPQNAALYNSREACPEELLLFFHHIPYQYRLKTGKTLIQHIYDTHFEGVEQVIHFQELWHSLKEKIDPERFEKISERLKIQLQDAEEWRDVVNSYFYRKTGIPDEKNRKVN